MDVSTDGGTETGVFFSGLLAFVIYASFKR